MKKKFRFYIIANFERGGVKRPVIIYENGSIEIPSVLLIKRTRYGKQYYNGIKENLDRLRYRKRDLRKDFRPMDRPLYFFEVLEKIRDQKNVSISRLWKFFYKNEVERIIGAILNFNIKRKISRLISQAFRKKPRDDEFLRKIGYIK